MRKILALAIFATSAAWGQVSNPSIIPVTTAPSGVCLGGLPDYQVISTGALFTCQSGVWAQISGGGSMVYPGAGIAVSTGSAWGTSLTAPASAIVGVSDTQTLTNKSIAGSEVNSGTLPHAQLPTLLSGDIPNNAANTTGNAATATAAAGTPVQCSAGTYAGGVTTTWAANCAQVQYSQLGGSVPVWNQNTTGNAANVTGVVQPANGGLGAASLTGYLYGNGSGAATASTTIPVASVTGAAPSASPTFTGTVTAPLTTAGVVTTTSGGVLGSVSTVPLANGGTGSNTAPGGLASLNGVPYSSAAYVGPCDILATASTPCVAAHSVTRRLFAAYSGSLFQLTRSSDNSTLDVSSNATTGMANLSSVPAFCASTSCYYTNVYDQTGNGNNLPQSNLTYATPYALSSGLPNTVPIMSIASGQYYRNRASTSLIPVGNTAITEYFIINTTPNSSCCGTYGDTEDPFGQGGKGNMFELAFTNSNAESSTLGTGLGPWFGVDLESGTTHYGGSAVPLYASFLAKYIPTGTVLEMKTGNALGGALTTIYNGLITSGYTAAWQGGLSLGEGGDGSPAPTNFFEGVVIASATSDATDNAVQANIASFYSGGPVNASSGCSTPQSILQQTASGGVVCNAGVTPNPNYASPTNAPLWLQNLGTGYDGWLQTTTGTMQYGEYWVTNFTVPYGTVAQVNIGGLVIHATGVCTIAGTLKATGATNNGAYGGLCGGAGGGSGGGAAVGTAGISSYPTIGTSYQYSGHGSGGSAGTSSGGAGGNGTTPSQNIQRMCADSGSGTDGFGYEGGGGAQGGSTGGAAGYGGDGVVLICGSIVGTDGTHTGIIDTSGGAGSPPSANSTGAGSGGGGAPIILSSQQPVTTWPNLYYAGGPGALATVPQALALGGSCTTQPTATLGVTSGALNGTCTVVAAGAGCGTGADVTWAVVGGGGTLGTGTVNPTWSGGALASCTTTAGTSSGYTAATYTTSGAGGQGAPGWYAEFTNW